MFFFIINLISYLLVKASFYIVKDAVINSYTLLIFLIVSSFIFNFSGLTGTIQTLLFIIIIFWLYVTLFTQEFEDFVGSNFPNFLKSINQSMSENFDLLVEESKKIDRRLESVELQTMTIARFINNLKLETVKVADHLRARNMDISFLDPYMKLMNQNNLI